MYVQSTHGGSIRRAISWTGIRRSDGPDRDPPQKTESEGIRQSQSIHQFLRVYLSVQFICFQFFGYYVAIGHFDVWPCGVSLQAMSPKQYSCFLRFRLLGWLVSRSVGWTLLRRLAVHCGSGSSHLIHCARRNFVSASSTNPGSASIPPRRKNPATKRG